MQNGSIRIDREAELMVSNLRYKAEKEGFRATKRDIVSWAIKQCGAQENEAAFIKWIKSRGKNKEA